MVALTLANKLASSSAILNAIGAEISLALEILDIAEVFTQHTPGRLLDIADALSRLFAPGGDGELPAALSGAKRREAPIRDDSFFRVWCINSPSSSSSFPEASAAQSRGSAPRREGKAPGARGR